MSARRPGPQTFWRHFAKAWAKSATSRSRMLRSNTVGRRVTTIDCRDWRPISCVDRWRCSGGPKMENAVKSFEPSIDHFIRIIGSGIEIFGVLLIVTGIAWSTCRQLRQPISEQDADVYKIRIGRSLLLVAADIVKTIAHELSVMSLGLLAGLVLVRTFLGWTLVLEIEGRWPWQREPSPVSSRARSGGTVDAHRQYND